MLMEDEEEWERLIELVEMEIERMEAERMVKKEMKKERSEISEEIEGILFELERIEADMTRSLEADSGEECMMEMEKMEGQAQVDECRRETVRKMGRLINRMKEDA
ncbi:hypothetical protein AAFF_G00174210 [Aldrovandia affinis]|uniref:Uncharacterized protein n=1 Tax=Aldrovandia affinis TaxID=143900 RepID=A0AAD7SZA5_9TELE|nr:hypothetical protein AAFF_G00174210 [Aldrovandia affinis]